MTEEPDRQLAALAEVQYGVFSIGDARACGLTRRQVERRIGRSWFLIHDGVYRIAGAPPTWRSELRAATLAAGDGAGISHRSAAALYGLPGAEPGSIELTCVRWKRAVRSGVIVHESTRLPSRDIQLIDAIPVTTPERTILDIASIYPNANYLEYVVQAARRKRLVTYESTRATFDRHARRGLKGIAALRETLERWDPGSRPTESDMETLLLQALRSSGLPEPVLQHVVVDARDRFVARVDAAYPSALIAIEYDSKQEHTDEFQIARDAKRRNALQAVGYAVLSVRHVDLKAGGNEICDQISTIMRRTAEPA